MTEYPQIKTVEAPPVEGAEFVLEILDDVSGWDDPVIIVALAEAGLTKKTAIILSHEGSTYIYRKIINEQT